MGGLNYNEGEVLCPRGGGTPIIYRAATPKFKWEIASYSGGDFGHSGEHLILYTDFTYMYSAWTDANFSHSYKGKYVIRDSSITLYPESERYNKRKVKVKDTASSYRMLNNTILFYSKEDEKKYPEIKEFNTLYLDKKKTPK
jgi:hypothetical protein